MKIKGLLILILCIALILTIYGPVMATDDKVSISFKIGGDSMNINGNSVKAERSYRVGNYTLVPLRSILEAFGAEVDWKGDGKITLVYRDTNIDLTIGAKKCIVNGVEKELPVAPAMSNGSTMVPSRFITENFGASVDYDSSSETVSITLADDGAIKDFSIITGGINKTKIGNSYFGWSINIPKGSQLIDNSVTSNKISIKNIQKEMSFEISVDTENSKTINDYFDDINKNPKKYMINKLVDSSVNKTSNPNYAEFIYSNYFGSSIKRIYISNGYVYDLILTLESGAKEDTLKSDTYFTGMMNSFSLDYKGKSDDIQDFSKVKDGLVKYENDTLGYSINVFPEWNIINLEPSILSVIGNSSLISNNEEGICVNVDKMEGNDNIDNYVNKIKESNSQNYNSKYYNFIELKTSNDNSSRKVGKLTYSLNYGSSKFIIEENVIADGNLVYDIVIKTFDGKYNTIKDKYPKIIDSFTYSTGKRDEILKGLGDYNDSLGNYITRVGKDDSPTLCESKEAKWDMRVPGNWLNFNSSFDDESQMYLSPKFSSMIAVRAVKTDDKNKGKTDEDKFELDSIGDSYKLIDKQTISAKGKPVRIYNYKMENEQSDLSAQVKLYIIDGDNYSYCFITMISDLYASEKNLKEIQDVWSSFNPKG